MLSVGSRFFHNIFLEELDRKEEKRRPGKEKKRTRTKSHRNITYRINNCRHEIQNCASYNRPNRVIRSGQPEKFQRTRWSVGLYERILECGATRINDGKNSSRDNKRIRLNGILGRVHLFSIPFPSSLGVFFFFFKSYLDGVYCRRDAVHPRLLCSMAC